MPLELDRVYREDCLKGLARLEEGSVDLAFADPPFNIGYDYDVYNDRKGYDEYLDWTRRWTAAVARVLTPTGTFWVAIGDEYAAEMKLILQNDCGLHCRNWVVWYYTFGVHCKHKFTRSHAHLFYFVKDRKRHTFHADAIRVPSARQLVYADKRAVEKGRLPDDTWIVPSETLKRRNAKTQKQKRNCATRSPGQPRDSSAEEGPGFSVSAFQRFDVPGFILRPQDVPGGFAPEGDTWYFSRVCGTFRERRGWHGCQMPEQLLARIIKACSNPADLVLDPFAGSGTTLAVAKKLGRRFLGFDISAKYAKQVTQRLAAIREGDPLTGPDDPLASAPPTAKGRRLNARPASRSNGQGQQFAFESSDPR